MIYKVEHYEETYNPMKDESYVDVEMVLEFQTEELAEQYISSCIEKHEQLYEGHFTEGSTTYIDDPNDYIAFTRLWKND